VSRSIASGAHDIRGVHHGRSSSRVLDRRRFEIRRAMGIAVFAGMLGFTSFGLFLTPVFFTFHRQSRRAVPEAAHRAGCCCGRECMRTIMLKNKSHSDHRCQRRESAKWPARVFRRRGAKVALSGRRAKLGETIAAQIRATGGTASFFRADISRKSDVDSLIASVVEEYGRIDCGIQ